jgi:hypothetical protein
MRSFWVPRAVAGQIYTGLEKSDGYPAGFESLAGEPVASWSDNLRFHMDPKFPKQTQLPDYVKNLHGHVIVSPAFEAVLMKLQQAHFEALPMKIVGLDGEVASAEHRYLNLFPLIDAVDQEKSGLQWNPIDPSRIMGCDPLVLDEERIPPDLHFFRLGRMPSTLVMSDALVQAIKAAALTGIKFERVEDFSY